MEKHELWLYMEYPITIGVGGHYEFAGDNAVAENFGVNLSAGIGF